MRILLILGALSIAACVLFGCSFIAVAMLTARINKARAVEPVTREHIPAEFKLLVIHSDKSQTNYRADIVDWRELDEIRKKTSNYSFSMPTVSVANLKTIHAGHYACVPAGAGYTIGTIQVDRRSDGQQDIVVETGERSTWKAWYMANGKEFIPHKFLFYDRGRLYRDTVTAFWINTAVWFSILMIVGVKYRRQLLAKIHFL